MPAIIGFLNPSALCPTFGWTHVVSATGGKTIYISGQVSVDEKGEVVGKGDMKRQTEQAFENIRLALASAGGSFQDVVKTNIYVVGLRPEHVPIIREIRGRYIWTENPPSSTLVGVSALVGPDWLIEIEAVAVMDEVRMTLLDTSINFKRGLENPDSLSPAERLVYLLMNFEALMNMEGWDHFFSYDHEIRYYNELKEGLKTAGDFESVEVLEDYERHLSENGVALSPEAIDAFLCRQGDDYFRDCRDWRDDYSKLDTNRWQKVSDYLARLGIALGDFGAARNRRDFQCD